VTAIPENDRPVTCPRCGCTRTDGLGPFCDRRKGLPGQWHFRRCAGCECAFQSPMPSEADLREYYSHYADGVRGAGRTGAGTKYPRLRRTYHMLTGSVDPRDFIRSRPGLRVLDVGCGEAPYLIDFAARGCDVAGAEIAQDIVTAYRERGFDVRAMVDGETIPFEDDRFDVVYMMQVIEHVRRPDRLFAELSRVTRRGGSVYMACPNGRSPWRRAFGAAWVSGWFAPFHLFVYTAPALAVLGAQHGFSLVRAWTRTPEAWLRLNLLAALRPGERCIERIPDGWVDRLVGRPARMLLARVADVLTGQGDCLVVAFRKTEREQ